MFLGPRRSLIKSPAVAAAAYTAVAVNFDGTNDYLTRGAGLTGAADGKNILLSTWFKRNGTGASRVLSNTGERCLLRFTSGNALFFVAVTTGGTTTGTVTSSGTYTTMASWAHLLIQLDSLNSICRMYVDGVDVSTSVTTSNNNTDLTLAEWVIGAFTDATNKYNGDLAEFFLAFADLDISVQANREKFRSSAGKPVDLGADGSTPLGAQPIIYFKNELSTWQTNLGSGGGFTENGALTSAATSPSD